MSTPSLAWIRLSLAVLIRIGAAFAFLGATTEIPILGKILLSIGLRSRQYLTVLTLYVMAESEYGSEIE